MLTLSGLLPPELLGGVEPRQSLTGRRSGCTTDSGLSFPENSAMSFPMPTLFVDVLKGRSSNTRVLEQLRAQGGAADLKRAMNAARRIRDPDYSLRAFYDDVIAAFPELGWYMVQQPRVEKTLHEPTSSSALPETEYRRTIGALFAVYWLSRIGIDGERGFSFGVDGGWTANKAPAGCEGLADVPFARMSAEQKRLGFFCNTPWKKLEDLMVDSGVLFREAGGAVRVSAERMAALLVLTAFHDIMKVELLRPSVAAEHAPYLGFAAGDTINDHDTALGYVLDHYAELLPSFQLVQPELQRVIRFTQAKFRFNNGWLVQGEAPPAATFAHFKQCICNQSIDAPDIAFYFAHWLTDLAGAEPTPLRGSEKFTLKFPHKVLASFINSFQVVERLADSSETDVLESYLRQRWRERAPPLGAEPSGPHAVALMRLVLQAQNERAQEGAYEAFWRMRASDRAVLESEMTQTGLAGQTFAGQEGLAPLLPSFLVYYAPALMQSLSADHGDEALRMLAELYRQARKIWPHDATHESGRTVTIRIDVIKDLGIDAIQDVYTYGEGWFLTKLNNLEGAVEKRPLSAADLPLHGFDQTQRQLLELWRTYRTDQNQTGVV